MEEELIHIDLIDKYLNQTLSSEELELFNNLMLKDPSFIEEVELYRMIYAGVEKNADDTIKERLNTYHQEYKNENPPKKEKGKVIKLIVKLSFAASILLGAYTIFNNNQHIAPINNTPSVVVTDSVETKKPKDSIFQKSKEVLVEENKSKKEIIPKQTPDKNIFYEDNSQLSIGGIEKLSQEQIKRIDYPQDLQYIFDGKKLSLYGDPLLPALQLKVLNTTSNQYVLQIKNSFFLIIKTTLKSNLVKTSTSYNLDKKTDEKISIKIESIIETSKPATNFKVLIKTSTSLPSYSFNNEAGELILSGNLDYSKALFFLVEQDGKVLYFLKIENSLYELNQNQETPSQLIKTDILKNRNTRLFRERDIFFKSVYVAN